MNFNSFPDDCILLIFGRLSLRTLVQIEIVCHKWSTLQTIACRDRRSLLLQIGGSTDNLIIYYEFEGDVNMLDLVNEQDNRPMFVSPYTMAKLHGLEFNDILSTQTCDLLITKFPKVSSLHISIADICISTRNVAEPVIALFTAWSSKLSTLKLYLFDHFDQSDYMSLLETINNQLLSLRNLTLCFDFNLFPFENDENDESQQQLHLPILSRLNRFCLASSYDQHEGILDSLVRYGQSNENLKQICLYRYHPWENVLSKFRALDPALTRCFTDLLLNVHFFKLSLFELRTLFRQFPNQQSQITINNNYDMNYSHEDLINSLPLLKNLISFHFHMSTNIPNSVQLNCSLPQLNSILMLSLSGVNSHTLLSQFNIAWIFPNIQIVVLRTLSFLEDYFGICDKCDKFSVNCAKENEKERFRFCMRMLLEPLKQCTKLRKIDFIQPPQYNIEDIVQECLSK